MKITQILKVSTLSAALILSTLATDATAREIHHRGGNRTVVIKDHGNHGGHYRRNYHHYNRNINVNVNRRGGYYDHYHHWHPIATAAAVTATAVIVGSMVNTLPSNCMTTIYGGIPYRQCSNVWYQPQGTQYVIVNRPW